MLLRSFFLELVVWRLGLAVFFRVYIVVDVDVDFDVDVDVCCSKSSGQRSEEY